MFLDITRARNPRLIEAALVLHRERMLPPNCFVIDVDTVAANAALLQQAADKNGISLYFTTKQIGFNPLLAKRVVEAGIPKAIAVDMREASVLSRNDIPIGHVGHLGQIPCDMIGPVLRLKPEVVTVFSQEKAEQISRVAARDGGQVQLLLRVASENDSFYTNQEGGIGLDHLLEAACCISKLPNVRIVGVTSFPCLQFDDESRTLKPTHNFQTMLKAAGVLRSELGIQIEQVNAPGNTCVGSMALLAEMGATHGEPGHALTGTTYLHAGSEQPEMPAIAYVSEVSHLYGNRAYVFGGGVYRRAKVNNALVGSRLDRMAKSTVLPSDPTAIDYYVSMELPSDQRVEIGDTVIVCSRAQIFVSRSYVAVVKGIQAGNPALLGLFDALGRAEERIF
ncbi:MAG: alanine racemase [Chloroflexi bacterium]|nr:alanine racemase [Chloroflexota bacterium]